ncbi:alpha/beta fold hydrolase [Shewanella cyperi]|uniref:alpha/beta fold hydrolase n=1 Tax=Shewanella cyperi TaxID=2814292 RepID=UPI001A94B3BD|nr:alpha/beta fold hydrolase [Shewanella cyperi]QSX39552.1 alpha/beta fold hydrolase [Shewanella cyperi]
MHSTQKLAGVIAHKHQFQVPLDHSQPNGAKIDLFVRELVRCGKENAELPFLVYFQGGPGFAAQRPMGDSGWIKRALDEYRVLLLDQRGTGLSSPINYQSLAGLNPNEQAEYLSHFRADNIVRDAEWVRGKLSPDTPWTILGQSFGGFCVLNYLSFAPQGLKEAYITGGIPPLSLNADAVYRATYKRVLQKNRDFHHRFPDAQALLDKLAAHITQHKPRLASGETLTVEMLQLLGIQLGMEGGPEAVYYLLEQALLQTTQGTVLNPFFAVQFSQMLDYNSNPLFAVLHEAIYCQGQASDWAAHRVRNDYPEFHYDADKPLLLTGEMIYPWMFEQFASLRPLRDAAHLLAAKQDWPALYDEQQLGQNQVPVAAAIYSEDMFVEMEYSLATAAKVKGLRYWLTSEYEHNGIRMDGERVLNRLIALNRGKLLR